MALPEDSMDRLGFLEPSSLTGESARLYKEIVDYFHVNYTYRFADGRMVGPFGIELHTPQAGFAWLAMTKALADLPGLPPLARELAIVAVAAHEQAAYATYAHCSLARSLADLPRAELEMIKVGQCPAHLGSECQIAVRVAVELCKPGPLPAGVWEEAVHVLGTGGATALVHYVGFYKYVGTILNGFDAKVPDSS